MPKLKTFRLDIQLEEWVEGAGWLVVHRQVKSLQQTLENIEDEYYALKVLMDE